MNVKRKIRTSVCMTGLVLSMAMAFSACSDTAKNTFDTSESVDSQAADTHYEAATQLMQDLDGTYEELWPVMLQSKFDDDWVNDSAAIVGDENAEASAQMMKSACSGTKIGQEAVDAYASAPDTALFDCAFTGGVSTFVFKDAAISGLDENGNTVFSHQYRYLQYDDEMGFTIYKSEDDDSGTFTYFAMAADTPASTYHIEFRYGSNLDDLSKYDSGDYAYWMAAGIRKDCDDSMVENAIELFCAENLKSEA